MYSILLYYRLYGKKIFLHLAKTEYYAFGFLYFILNHKKRVVQQ